MKDKRFKHWICNYDEDNPVSEVHDYFKLKFEDRKLTDYEFLLWVKLFYYMKHKEETSAEEPSPDLLDRLRKEYSLPVPTNNSDSLTLFTKIRDHEWIKLQDDTGKYLYGPFSETVLQVPSFSINRFQRSLNITIAHLRKQIYSGDITDELKEKTRWMIDCIRGINYFVSLFFTSTFTRLKSQTPPDVFQEMSSPYSSYLTTCKEIYTIIMPICDDSVAGWEAKGFKDEMRMPILLPKFLELKGIAGFSCLSGFFVDSMFFSFDFVEPLINIFFFLHSDFHNSLLWRIEFAASPVNLGTPPNQRGQKDHTTQMKIFLFDSKDRPRVIRIDMPHKGKDGEQYLHFNVKPVFDGESFDHHIITHNCDQIQSVLESVREAMIRECPYLFEIKDTDEDEDDTVLSDMERFLIYESLTTEYIVQEHIKEALDHYNAHMQTHFLTLNEALEDAYLHFYTRF